ncbi:MAG: hypothetical protein AABN95_15925 [Acidobacteriota bacterium]
MAVKNLYKVQLDIKKRQRWLENWVTLRIVANGNLHTAINKAERVGKRLCDAQKARATSIEWLAEIDAV